MSYTWVNAQRAYDNMMPDEIDNYCLECYKELEEGECPNIFCTEHKDNKEEE